MVAQAERRVGLVPIVRRRITASGVPPLATGSHTCDHCYRYGAVEPTTGDSVFLALPWRNPRAFPLWGDHFAAAFPHACNLLVLDKGALHKAQALQWPSHSAPMLLPPYSPELHPIERLGRDVKEKRADCGARTLDELSTLTGYILQSYSPAALQALTGYAYFVEAVTTAIKNVHG